MNIYLVRSARGDAWVAYEGPEARLYSYVPNTGKFHRNDGLTTDFFIEQRMEYVPLTREQARGLVDAGRIGRIDARRNGFVLDKFRADTDPIDPATILGQSNVTPRPTPQQQALARARALNAAASGHAVTWKRYSREQRHLALVAVNDIRKGKVKALHKLGAVEARLVEDDTEVRVEVVKP